MGAPQEVRYVNYLLYTECLEYPERNEFWLNSFHPAHAPECAGHTGTTRCGYPDRRRLRRVRSPGVCTTSCPHSAPQNDDASRRRSRSMEKGVILQWLMWCKREGNWSGRCDSNARPSPWQGDALPLSYARSIALWPQGKVLEAGQGPLYARRSRPLQAQSRRDQARTPRPLERRGGCAMRGGSQASNG